MPPSDIELQSRSWSFSLPKSNFFSLSLFLSSSSICPGVNFIWHSIDCMKIRETETWLPFIYLCNLPRSFRNEEAVYPNSHYPSFISRHRLFAFGWFNRNTIFSLFLVVIWQVLLTDLLKTLWVLLVKSTFFVSLCAKVNVSFIGSVT